MTKKICILCGQKYEGLGNNAEPLANGRCCDFCNYGVLAHRVKLISLEEARKTENEII